MATIIVTRRFPRLFRLGLIEAITFIACPPFLWRFPRLFRLGLIEASGDTTLGARRPRWVFPGFSAWASLKRRPASQSSVSLAWGFPRLFRLGLIEAWAQAEDQSGQRRFPRLFRLGLIEARRQRAAASWRGLAFSQAFPSGPH